MRKILSLITLLSLSSLSLSFAQAPPPPTKPQSIYKLQKKYQHLIFNEVKEIIITDPDGTPSNRPLEAMERPFSVGVQRKLEDKFNFLPSADSLPDGGARIPRIDLVTTDNNIYYHWEDGIGTVIVVDHLLNYRPTRALMDIATEVLNPATGDPFYPGHRVYVVNAGDTRIDMFTRYFQPDPPPSPSSIPVGGIGFTFYTAMENARRQPVSVSPARAALMIANTPTPTQPSNVAYRCLFRPTPSLTPSSVKLLPGTWKSDWKSSTATLWHKG